MAAHAAFAEPDADVSMAEIARRAGVGMATLYRNFPGRRELLEALYTDEVDALCDAADTADGATPGARFTTWLRRFLAYFTSRRHIAGELLQHAEGDDPVFGRNRARVIAAGQPLLGRRAARARGPRRPHARADPRHDRCHGQDPRRRAVPRTDPAYRARWPASLDACAGV